MNEWLDNYMTRHKSLGFYLKEHQRISNEELLLFFENPEEAQKLKKTVEESRQELFVIVVKILSDLRDMLSLLEHVDLYKEERDDFEKNEKEYLKLFAEREDGEDEDEKEEHRNDELQNKFRKYGILMYLNCYQERYETLFSSGGLFKKKYRENSEKIDIEKVLL